MKTSTTSQQDDSHDRGHDTGHGRPGRPADPPTEESEFSDDAEFRDFGPEDFGDATDTGVGVDADADREGDARADARANARRASSTRSPIADVAIELATLGQRWIALILEKGWIGLRAHITEILTVIGLCLLGGILVLGGIAYLDLLVYRWLVVALDSANWALFALALGHVAIGGVLIRAALQRMRGEDES